MSVDIKELVQLQSDLKNRCTSAGSSVERDAQVNLLKYLQTQTVYQFQAAYDGLYFELNKEGGLDCLREITPARSKDLLQPKVIELQDCDEDAKLGKQLKFYLKDAALAKPPLDKLVEEVVKELEGCTAKFAEVKSEKSTTRKASNFCGGDVRKVTDMARVSVVCDKPHDLERAFSSMMGRLQPQNVRRVANGFNSDWMANGYRDVKVNAVVNDHLCEIQLQLRQFHEIKEDQHAVYKWARDLAVSTEMHAEQLFENLSREVVEEMMSLALQGWRGTGYCLLPLQIFAGQYPEAEKHSRKLLSEADDVLRGLEPNSTEWRQTLLTIANARSNLGLVLQKQGKYDEAGLFFERSLASCEEAQGRNHPAVASVLNNQALLSKEKGKYEEAEPLCGRSLAIRVKAFGLCHPAVATARDTWAGLLKAQGKYAEAEPLLKESQAIREKVLGPKHPDVALSLNNRAGLLSEQGKYAEAQELIERALEINKEALGVDHPSTITYRARMADLCEKQGFFDKASPLIEEIVSAQKLVVAHDNPDYAFALNNWAEDLRAQGKIDKARRLHESALAIFEKALGPHHPHVATSLNNLGGVLESQGNYKEAGRRYYRSLAIREKSLGPDHPHLAVSLNNLGGLLESQGKYAAAEGFVRRRLAIDEQVYGPQHPEIATDHNNLADLLSSQGKYAEAIPLLERAFEIRKKVLGGDHPDTIGGQDDLEFAREQVLEA